MWRLTNLLAGAALAAATTADASWVLVPSGTTQDLHAVGTDAFFVEWLVGGAGTICKSTNNGVSWSASGAATADFRGFLSTSSIDYWACGTGAVWFSSNQGITWLNRSPATAATLLDLGSRSSGAAFAVGTGGTIFKSTNSGASWTAQTSGTGVTLHAVLAATFNNATMLAAGDAGTILRTTDGGATWNAVASGTSETLHDLEPAGGQNGVVACGTNGTVLRSTDLGATWTVLTTGIPDDLYSISAGSTVQLTAVGAGGAIHRSTDTGATWTAQWSPTAQDLLGVKALSSTVQIAVGANGTVIRTDDGGAPPVGVEAVPAGEASFAGHPNPFRHSTTVTYSVPAAGRVHLAVYDAAGRAVATLRDGPAAAGEHAVTWNGRDATGAPVHAGVYFLRLHDGSQVSATKVLRLD